MRVIRNSGPALEVSSQVHAEIEAGYSPPSEQEAHPPLGGLFYRFWDPEHSQGRNSAQGFVAKRHVHSNAVPARAYAPPAMHLDPTDLFYHLNGTSKVELTRQRSETHESTPFVSVSDSLTWSLSKVLKLVKSGEWKSARLSVIDGTKLASASIFHAAGFYRQLKKLRCFTNGAHRGVSSHEYLIWRDIICARSRNAAPLRDALRARSIQTVIRPALQRNQVSLDASTVTSMANLAQKLHVHPDSPFEHHRHLIHDLVSSYKLLVTHHTPRDWLTMASHYAHVFVRASSDPVPAIAQAKLKLAFLRGVRLGAVTDLKLARLDGKAMGALQRKARLIGIEDIGRMVADEADAVKVHVGLEQRRQWKAFSGGAERMVVGGDELSGDGESVFEMDDDGLVL